MRLATWRREKGLTQEELASRLGCTQPYISLLERSAEPAAPSSDFMRRLCRLTRGAVTPNDIVFPDGLPDFDTAELPFEAPAPLLDGAGAGHGDAEKASPEGQLQDLAA